MSIHVSSLSRRAEECQWLAKQDHMWGTLDFSIHRCIIEWTHIGFVNRSLHVAAPPKESIKYDSNDSSSKLQHRVVTQLCTP